MSSWADLHTDSAEFAERVRAIFATGTNKTLATIRADGSPRISASELKIADGRVTLGMMPGSRKLQDVTRDPRVAIHSPNIEPPEPISTWLGDAKLSGRLLPASTPDGGTPGAYFELDIDSAVITRVNDAETMLVIESWHPGNGYRRIERE